MHVILDISRLIGCVRRSAPSGIDRVEMAYARHWLTKPEADCTMAAESAWGGFGALPRRDVVALLDALEDLGASGNRCSDLQAKPPRDFLAKWKPLTE